MKKAWLGLALLALVPSVAHAGGFEVLGNNTEALGRGGAFTAKADDGSAMEYNVAGYARQRGTHTLFSGNLLFKDYEFSRAGTYPGDPNDPATPYAGQPYPTVKNTKDPFFAPYFAVSTDFDKLERWTFAFGIFGPSSYGNPKFGRTVDGLPSPARYDVTSAGLLIMLPTFSAAVRVTRWLDLGVALHLVYGSFTLGNASFVDLGRGQCPFVEYAPCDSYSTLHFTGFTATASLGVMLHPVKGLDIGLNFRGPLQLDAKGKAESTSPPAYPLDIQPEDATFHTRLPAVLRAGVRYAFIKDGFEHGDLELDGTYENWHWAEGEGDKINIPTLAIFSEINPVITHHFSDTFSVRLGGAFNSRVAHGKVILTARLGLYYDSSPTKNADTRVDFDTQAKLAPTIGLGLRVRGISINGGYAYVWSPDRTVTDGDIGPINPIRNGTSESSQTGVYLPAVNNGKYHAATQILSGSISIYWEELVKGKPRTVSYE